LDDSNREAAGQKYELIRTGLIRIFVSNGFSDAEDLTDEVINRVMKRLPEVRPGYVGEPARFFHGFARNVVREARRRPRNTDTDTMPVIEITITHESDEYECLIKCLKFLPAEKKELILDYYLYKGQDKIEHHKRMAIELGITDVALRGRAHQLRTSLEKCIKNCVSLQDKTKPPLRTINS
jgi:DNA-directed RNA polymerase specialized sigma24 family protein